jgi:hypothetical protein
VTVVKRTTPSKTFATINSSKGSADAPQKFGARRSSGANSRMLGGNHRASSRNPQVAPRTVEQ